MITLFEGIQKEFVSIQINQGPIDEVFKLLCPVREQEWIEGWEYNMVHSTSGLAELNCVFTTPHHGKFDTVWQVTQYDSNNHFIEFVRVTPQNNCVRINIKLEKITESTTRAIIKYLYTGLSDRRSEAIDKNMEASFSQSMDYWEQALNYYLTTGKKLIKKEEKH